MKGSVSRPCSCKVQKRKTSTLPFWTSLLVILLPKCPFCVLSYGTAITLCSGKTIYQHESTEASWISTFLILIILLSILFNRKGRKTLIALFAASSGAVFILLSEWYTGELSTYYIGAVLLLFGALWNGSLSYALNYIRKQLGYKQKHNHTIIIKSSKTIEKYDSSSL